MKEERDYRGKLMRLFRIIMLLMKSPDGMTVRELETKTGLSYRTIYRDLKLLGEVGFPPEQIGRGRFIIRGMDAEGRKIEKNLRFSAEEAGLLSRTVHALDDTMPLKRTLLEKLRAFSGTEDMHKAIVKQQVSNNYAVLAQAMRDKKTVTLHNYRSANSQSVKSRRIEPYAFSEDGVAVRGYEINSRLNKSYKIERIEEVILESFSWQHQAAHEPEIHQDIFGIQQGEPEQVHLRLSMRAAQYLREEFPLSGPFIYKEGAQHFIFEAHVNTFKGIGRFVLGLLDEVEVLGPPRFVEYLENRIAARQFGG